LGLLLSACATPIKHEQLVPQIAPTTTHATGERIQVDPVIITDVPKKSWTVTIWESLDQDTFTNAILDTLDRSGMFSTVSTTGPADYRLSADLVGQQLIGSVSNIMLLLVRYQLVDTASGNILWTENLFSFHHLSGAEVFMGADRSTQVVEAAVRQNLQQLVVRLDENL
jgi:hypothetical protein